MSDVADPFEGPLPDGALRDGSPVVAPRLRRKKIRLTDGHQVGIAVAGEGVPLVVVHGFSAEGFLYAQTLHRLVSMGFKVIAIDTAGHGGTRGLPASGHDLREYSVLLGRVIDELGIERCILAGHSMGGRLVTDLAAERPERTIAVMLIDAIVGDTWDKMVYGFRLYPPLLAAMGAALVADSLTVVPFARDPRQAVKFLRLALPTVLGDAVRPWRLLGPVVSILRSRSSRYSLQAVGDAGVPVYVMHGDRDWPVPMRTARDAARRARGTLITVRGGGHSWLLRDPETLPGIVSELLESGMRDAIDAAAVHAGVEGRELTDEEFDAVFYRPQALIHTLTPSTAVSSVVGRHWRPVYRWTVSA